jgi:hypothetical protein
MLIHCLSNSFIAFVAGGDKDEATEIQFEAIAETHYEHTLMPTLGVVEILASSISSVWSAQHHLKSSAHGAQQIAPQQTYR